MTCNPVHTRARATRFGASRGFTLAEVLAAMLFMAIVIPVAVEGLRVATLAGEVGQRKVVAARIGNKILNELKVTGQLQTASQNGVVTENGIPYHWSVRAQNWTEDPKVQMMVDTLTVSYTVQGKNYDVQLSTLVAPNTTL